MNHLSSLITTGVLLVGTTLLPVAPATAQSLQGRVAVGPIGSATRTWTSVTEAQLLCQQGCWISDGVETSPGNWVPNTAFPGARAFQEPGTGHGLLEVRP